MVMDTDEVSSVAGPRWRLDLRVLARSESLVTVRRSLAALAISPELLHDARLLVSELVGNSIRHSGLRADEYVRIDVDRSGARLRVTVHDRLSSSAPIPVADPIGTLPVAASGWGLFIVDRLASRWGTNEAGYWFELQLDGNERHPEVHQDVDASGDQAGPSNRIHSAPKPDHNQR
ncbi:MAG: ATP-binding protein [Actinomycetota bacterium]